MFEHSIYRSFNRERQLDNFQLDKNNKKKNDRKENRHFIDDQIWFYIHFQLLVRLCAIWR